MSNVFYDENIEQELIGYLLINNNFLDSIMDKISADMFYFADHKKIFDTIKNVIIVKNSVADVKSVARLVQIDRSEKEIEKYLYDCVEIASTSILNIGSISDAIQDYYFRRSSEELIDKIKGAKDVKNALHEAEKDIYNLLEKTSIKQKNFELSFFTDQLKDKLTRMKKSTDDFTGLSTGLIDLDRFLDGLHKSDLIILAARPSMGKTALAVNIGYNIAKKINSDNTRNSVGVFSLEMSGEQVAMRIMAMNRTVDPKILRTGKNKKGQKMSDLEYAELLESIEEMSDLPMYIDDTSALDIESLKIRARHMKIKHNISILIIDYLQLIRGSKNKSGDNRVQEVSEITQSLKAIAKDLNIPVVALSQLSRDVEKRDDKKPQLSDLRESGSIEQDADIVMFLYREIYYHERNMPKCSLIDDLSQYSDLFYQEKKREFEFSENRADAERLLSELEKFHKWYQGYNILKNEADLLILKNRHGPVGNVKLSFIKEHTKFGNYLEQKQSMNRIQNANIHIDKELKEVF